MPSSTFTQTGKDMNCSEPTYELHCGDSAAVLREIPTDSIDLTVTSPPYDDLRTYNGYSFDFETIAKELWRVTAPGGVVVWNVNDATKQGSETGTSFRQVLFFKSLGFNIHDTMIWEKTGSGALGSRLCYAQNFEFMFVLSKGRPKAINLICDRENVIKSGKATVNGQLKADKTSSSRTIERKPFGKRTNIWRIPPQQRTEHPAPFPEQLALDHIRSWSNPGDLVLDPFLGSGTTGKVAVQSSRRFVGIELSEDYLSIARERIGSALQHSGSQPTKHANDNCPPDDDWDAWRAYVLS